MADGRPAAVARASLCLGVLVVALAVGLRDDLRWIARGAGVGLLLAVVTAVVLAVPTLDLRRDPDPQPSGPGRAPCFSGTECDAAG
ncbi:hypothetical protein [Aeromicrobium endophyticum]|uniref:Uncharacterized protein n=1 Tax=Aeromicrobium endophyticum TaxID=2292704 RepID=A0A371P2F4_9ACTN|nr:hypothetical protein [Aeromicrobium endophyticum]REK70133.1 hypothetical protein DX116_13255 [Aeromicrobium endophyticum]